jgi:tetratricopeptide (TPR) repeat protein
LNANSEIENGFARWKSLVEEGNQAYLQNHFALAETTYADALKEAESWPKVESPQMQNEIDSRLGKSLNNMAALYHTQGKYKMAEELYLRALELKRRLYGEEHEEVALNLQNLAITYGAKKNYEQAERFFKRALEIREKLLGMEHPDIAQTLRNYALLLRKQGRKEESERLEQRAATLLKKK